MKYAIANWKMNPQSAEEALRLFETVGRFLRTLRGATVVICPPFVWIPFLGHGPYAISHKPRKRSLRPTADGLRLALGAQDLSWESQGAFTGEISGPMLKDLGCSYVIVGHSERRWKIGESDEVVRKKVKAAFAHRLRPILCVGEKTRNDETWENAVKEQVIAATRGISRTRIADLIIAYEPVWAIGTGIPDTPDSALSAVILIRKTIARIFSNNAARTIPILYGGSVTEKNAARFMAQEGIDGFLVGGASLRAGEFAHIAEIVQAGSSR